MNLFKRSIISIRRCLGRSFVLFGADNYSSRGRNPHLDVCEEKT